MKNRLRKLYHPSQLALLIGLLLSLLSCKSTDFGTLNLNQLGDTISKISDLGSTSDQQEASFGEEVSQKLLSDSRILNNNELQYYVNNVGQWLVLNSERPDLTWHFIVLDDKSFNAFAAPGGYIFITAGTLLRLNSEAELAGVLSHEIAHVLKKHYFNVLQKETSLDLASDIGMLAYQFSSSKNSSDTAKNIQLAEQVSNAVDSLYSNGLAREDEEQADAMALVINARAGYDPYAYISVLQQIASEKNSDSAWTSFMQRHPPASDRLANLAPLLELPFMDQDHYLTLVSRYQQSIR